MSDLVETVLSQGSIDSVSMVTPEKSVGVMGGGSVEKGKSVACMNRGTSESEDDVEWSEEQSTVAETSKGLFLCDNDKGTSVAKDTDDKEGVTADIVDKFSEESFFDSLVGSMVVKGRDGVDFGGKEREEPRDEDVVDSADSQAHVDSGVVRFDGSIGDRPEAILHGKRKSEVVDSGDRKGHVDSRVFAVDGSIGDRPEVILHGKRKSDGLDSADNQGDADSRVFTVNDSIGHRREVIQHDNRNSEVEIQTGGGKHGKGGGEYVDDDGLDNRGDDDVNYVFDADSSAFVPRDVQGDVDMSLHADNVSIESDAHVAGVFASAEAGVGPAAVGRSSADIVPYINNVGGQGNGRYAVSTIVFAPNSEDELLRRFIGVCVGRLLWTICVMDIAVSMVVDTSVSIVVDTCIMDGPFLWTLRTCRNVRMWGHYSY